MKPRLTPAHTNEIIRRYKAGESSVELARAFRVTPQTIQVRCHAAGIIRNFREASCGAGARRPREITYDITDDGCWLCTSHRCGSDGYPKIRINGLDTTVGHVMWERANGPLPGYAMLMLTCQNRLCINPDHRRRGPKPNLAAIQKRVCRNDPCSAEFQPRRRDQFFCHSRCAHNAAARNRRKTRGTP